MPQKRVSKIIDEIMDQVYNKAPNESEYKTVISLVRKEAKEIAKQKFGNRDKKRWKRKAFRMAKESFQIASDRLKGRRVTNYILLILTDIVLSKDAELKEKRKKRREAWNIFKGASDDYRSDPSRGMY